MLGILATDIKATDILHNLLQFFYMARVKSEKLAKSCTWNHLTNKHNRTLNIFVLLSDQVKLLTSLSPNFEVKKGPH